MKLLLIGNCHLHTIGPCMQLLLPDADIHSALLGTAHDEAAHRLRSEIATYDVVCTHPLVVGPLRSADLRELVPSLFFIPPMAFTGFHPDNLVIASIRGPMGANHSAIIVASYLLGLSPRRCAGLFNAFTYASLGYLDRFERSALALLQLARQCGLSFDHCLGVWPRPFMLDVYHPKFAPLASLAELLARRIAGDVRLVDWESSAIHSEFQNEKFAVWPVYPEIARRLDLPEEEITFRYPQNAPGMALEEFVERSYAIYATADAATMSQAVEVELSILKDLVQTGSAQPSGGAPHRRGYTGADAETRPAHAFAVAKREAEGANTLTRDQVAAGTPSCKVVAIGHSHLTAVHMAEHERERSPAPTAQRCLAFLQLLDPRFRPNFAVVGGVRRLAPTIEKMMRQELDGPDSRASLVVAMVGGNEHALLGTARHQRPFDFVLPEKPDLPFDTDAEQVPCGIVEAALECAAADSFIILSELRRMVEQPVLCVSPPPPIGDNEYLLSQQTLLAERAREHGVASPLMRWKLWQFNVDTYRRHCEKIGIEFLPAPSEARDSDGFLERGCWHQDGIHGNQKYGELVLRQIDGLLPCTGATRTWS